MVKNIVFFIAWVGVFFLSMFGIVYVLSPNYLVSFQINNTIILIVSIVYFLIALFRFICIFQKEVSYEINSSFGNVSVSIESIKGIIKETLNKDNEIKNLKITCGKKGKKYKVVLFIELHTQQSIAEKSNLIQEIVKNELFNKLELEIDIIEVKISKVSINPKEETNN